MAIDALQLRAINTYCGESHVLCDLSLSLRAGSLLALLGRNGVGKSTCVHSIIGFLPPASGAVLVFGENVAGLPPERIAALGVGLVPQGRRVFTSLSVEENLGVAWRRPPLWCQAEAWSPARVFARFPRLQERRKSLAGKLSGGEQQLLAIARALVTQPRILLLDEPSEGLAPRIVAELQEVIRELRSEGLAILLVEQNAQLALALADDVLILNTARVAFSGPVADIRQRPDFLAAQLGVA